MTSRASIAAAASPTGWILIPFMSEGPGSVDEAVSAIAATGLQKHQQQRGGRTGLVFTGLLAAVPASAHANLLFTAPATDSTAAGCCS